MSLSVVPPQAGGSHSQSAHDSPLLPVYNRCGVVMARGEGVYLFDTTGKRYLDFAAGIAVNALGHCHPRVVQALLTQGQTLWHCSNLFHTEPQDRLASRLQQHSFADRIFFTNSGSEAVETAIKMARKFHSARGVPKPRIITASGSFHGRSIACISAGKNQRATQGFEPLLEGFDQVPFGDVHAVKKSMKANTGAILLETVQGEGGIRHHSLSYLQEVRHLANEHGLLLILDEVQCGMGRTGSLFAFEPMGIAPDICTIAKGIGGGFPLGACLATRSAASGMTLGTHGGTYGGNALATAVGNAVLDELLAEGFLAHVTQMGEMLKKALEWVVYDHPKILAEVRGKGLMLGIKPHVFAQDMVVKLRDAGLITVASAEDNVVRLLPPLIIEETHVTEAVNRIREVCEAWN